MLLLSSISVIAQCKYENPTESLGIGLLSFDNFNHIDPVLEIFNDQNLTNLFCKWRLYDETNTAPVCAKFHKPDYGIAQLVVVEKLKKSYKVIINGGDIKYLPQSNNYIFLTWTEYLKESHGIRRKVDNSRLKTQPLRDRPDQTGNIIKSPNEKFELFCVMEVKNDWIQVKYDCFYNKDSNPNDGMSCSTYIEDCGNSTVGWIKWREASNILIDIFTMP